MAMVKIRQSDTLCDNMHMLDYSSCEIIEGILMLWFILAVFEIQSNWKGCWNLHCRPFCTS